MVQIQECCVCSDLQSQIATYQGQINASSTVEPMAWLPSYSLTPKQISALMNAVINLESQLSKHRREHRTS